MSALVLVCPHCWLLPPLWFFQPLSPLSFLASSFVGCGARRVLPRILVLIHLSPQFSPCLSPCCGSGWAGMRGFWLMCRFHVACLLLAACRLVSLIHMTTVLAHSVSGLAAGVFFFELSTHYCFNTPAKSGCLDRTTTRCHFERVGSSGKLTLRNG